MPQRTPFIVSLVVDDDVIETHHSFHNLRRTLRLAYKLIDRVPSAYVGVRYKGERIAELETNWRGELAEANVYAERRIDGLPYPWLRVTSLNCHGPLFHHIEERHSA